MGLRKPSVFGDDFSEESREPMTPEEARVQLAQLTVRPSVAEIADSVSRGETYSSPFPDLGDNASVGSVNAAPKTKITPSYFPAKEPVGVWDESLADEEEDSTPSISSSSPPTKAATTGSRPVLTTPRGENIPKPAESDAQATEDTALQQAYESDRRSGTNAKLLGGIGGAFNSFLSEMTGTKADPAFWQNLSSASPSRAKELLEQRGASDKALERQSRALELQEKTKILADTVKLREEKSEPTSNISKLYRDELIGMGKTVDDSMSAASLEHFLDASRKAELHSMDLAAKKASRDESRIKSQNIRDDKTLARNTAFSTHAITKLSNSENFKSISAANKLLDKIDSYANDPNGFKQMGLQYGFIKGLDPNAVKEAELRLINDIGSIPRKTLQRIRQAFSGTSYGDTAVREMREAVKDMHDSSLKDYRVSARIYDNIAKKQGIEKQLYDPLYQAKPLSTVTVKNAAGETRVIKNTPGWLKGYAVKGFFPVDEESN